MKKYNEVCVVCGMEIEDAAIQKALDDMPFEIDTDKMNCAHAECAISDGMAEDDEHIREIGVYIEETN